MPWLDTLGVPGDWTWAQFLNSQFLSTLVNAIVVLIAAMIGKNILEVVIQSAAEQGAQNARTEAAQIEREEVAQIEAEQEPATDPARGENFREQARELVEGGKTFLDTKARNDPDGRHRRTYETLNRYDYMPLAVALNVRGQISAQQLAGAAALFTRWKLFAKGRAASKPVPREAYDHLVQAHTDLTQQPRQGNQQAA